MAKQLAMAAVPATLHPVARLLVALILAGPFAGAPVAVAQEAPPAAAETTQPTVRQFLDLLADPAAAKTLKYCLPTTSRLPPFAAGSTAPPVQPARAAERLHPLTLSGRPGPAGAKGGHFGGDPSSGRDPDSATRTNQWPAVAPTTGVPARSNRGKARFE